MPSSQPYNYPTHGLALQITKRLQTTPMTLARVAIPQKLGPLEVLIEVHAAAQNPVDYKRIDSDLVAEFPATVGGDAAGVLLAVGRDVQNLKTGDRVTAFLQRKTARNAAYQQYAIGQAPQTIKIPAYLSFEKASAIPLAYATAVGGVFGTLGIPIPPAGSQLPVPYNQDPPILVWGGSSSVGAYVIQLCRLSGFRTVATASPANSEYVKSLGAETVVDYREGEKAVEEIKRATGGKLRLVYDAISEKGSTALAAESLGPEGGIINTVLSADDSAKGGRQDVQVILGGARLVFEKPEILDAYRFLSEALEQKVFAANRVEVLPGGLLGVSEGFERQKAGQVSGVKLVYRVLDTPGLERAT